MYTRRDRELGHFIIILILHKSLHLSESVSSPVKMVRRVMILSEIILRIK